MTASVEIIKKANPHTIKKFQLIERYVKEWAQKLLNYSNCQQLVFIDCMCSSGEYFDDMGQTIYGTPVRVSKYLRQIAPNYPSKRIDVYYNDICSEKVDHLETLLEPSTGNYSIHTSRIDGNVLLRNIGRLLTPGAEVHYLLVYDPYDASIDWMALQPFLNNWGEVIINHMISDSMRAVKMAKTPEAVEKYQMTYLTDIESLIPFGSDKSAYEERIEAIINILHRGERRYYVSAFPFFNRRNAIVYNLIHCTGHPKGFSLYKKTAWQVFGGKSSDKNTHGAENQLSFLFDGGDTLVTQTDEYCYYLKDVAAYLQSIFCGRQSVPLSEVWAVLEDHPIFPSEGFKPQIKAELKRLYGTKESNQSLSFTSRK